jgi:hypothetical protein
LVLDYPSAWSKFCRATVPRELPKTNPGRDPRDPRKPVENKPRSGSEASKTNPGQDSFQNGRQTVGRRAAYNNAMQRNVCLIAMILLMACSHPKPAPPQQRPIADAGTQPLPTTPVVLADQLCRGVCDTTDSCTRPNDDQICTCGPAPDIFCGGDMPNESNAPHANFKKWSCKPRNPLRDRGDGCPVEMPAEKTTCSSANQSCAYNVGACGRETHRRVCDGNQWVAGEIGYAPVPS